MTILKPISKRVPGGVTGASLLAAVGAALAGAALYNRQAADQAERDHPPRGRFTVVDGVRVHYLDVGSGSPILLLHGNGATAEDFVISGLLDRLATHYRVIVPDRPGYGFTERPSDRRWTPFAQADLFADFLQGLRIERPIVLGHSWGTQVSLALALQNPRDVAALMLLSGYYYPTARADVLLLSTPAIPVVGDAMVHTVSPLISRAIFPALARRIFQPRPVPGRFWERFPKELAVRPSQLRASAEETAFMVPAAAELSRRYGELRCPVSIMAGDGDRIVDFGRQSGRLHDELEGSELAVLRGVGHMIHYAAADKIAAGVDALAKR